MPKSIVVFLHHGLGDLICAIPPLHCAVKTLSAGDRLTVIVRSHIESTLLESLHWGKHVIAIPLSDHSKGRRTLKLMRVLAKLRIAKTTHLLMPHVSSEILARLIKHAVGAAHSIIPGSGRNTERVTYIQHSSRFHKTQHYASYFQAARLIDDKALLDYPPLPHSSLHAVGPATRIVLAPAVGASLEQHKAWPDKMYSELSDLIVDRWPSAQIELFASPSELHALRAVFEQASSGAKSRLSIVTPSTPLAAAQHLVDASCVVTSCSGASHIAAWAGTPIVGIFGPTNPGYTGPHSKRLFVVRAGLPCSPCYRSTFISGCGTPTCMTSIHAYQVLQAVEDALSGIEPPNVPFLETVAFERHRHA